MVRRAEKHMRCHKRPYKNECFEDQIEFGIDSAAAVFYHTSDIRQTSVTPHVSDCKISFGWISMRIINNRPKVNPQIPVVMFAKCLIKNYDAFVSFLIHLSWRTFGICVLQVVVQQKHFILIAVDYSILPISSGSGILWFDEVQELNLCVITHDTERHEACNRICHVWEFCTSKFCGT